MTKCRFNFIMPIQTKICGLTTPGAVRAAVEGGAAFAGFVFYPRSPRHLQPETAAMLASLVPPTIKKVAVMVNPSDMAVREVTTLLQADYLQLHGDEIPERVKEIRKKFRGGIIKAVTVRNSDDVAAALAYREVADMLLFDARAPETPGNLPGGNGLRFDWELLRGRKFDLPWMLSGGLNAENIAEAVAITGARIVDVSSGVESAPGVKDPALIKGFLGAAAKIP